MNYKEFMMTLPDDVSPEEAQEAYERYQAEFSKSEERIFWEAHKKESWFQERYDPVVLEQLRQSKTKHVIATIKAFPELVEEDKIVELKLNVEPLKPEASSGEASAEPAGDVDNKEDEAKEGEPEEEEEAESSPRKADDEEAAEPGVDEPAGEAEPAEDAPMDATKPGEAETGKKRKEFRGPQSRDPTPKKPKRKKTPPPKLPTQTTAQMSLSDKFFGTSVYIQGIPLDTKRTTLLAIFKKRDGFQKLVLCDPGHHGQVTRFGWANFASKEDVTKTLVEVDNGGLNGTKVNNFFLNLWPKARFKPRFTRVPTWSLHPTRMEQDLMKSLSVVKKLDKEKGVKKNPVLDTLLANQPSNLRKLNLVLAYLRRVHFTCYYSGETGLTEEQMITMAGPCWERVDLPAEEDWDTYKPSDQDYRWAEELDEKIDALLVSKPPETLKAWLDRQKTKIFKDNTIKVADEKFRCALCRKLFRGPNFVHKHLVNKHEPVVKKYIQAERDKHYFENYSHDPNKLLQKDLDQPQQALAKFNPGLGREQAPMPGGFGNRLQALGRQMVEPERQLPVHYTAPPPRTYASYKDVVLEEELGVEVVEASDDELDYGFGDYVIPPKFNL